MNLDEKQNQNPAPDSILLNKRKTHASMSFLQNVSPLFFYTNGNTSGHCFGKLMLHTSGIGINALG